MQFFSKIKKTLEIEISKNSENFNRKKPTEIKLREETEDCEERD